MNKSHICLSEVSALILSGILAYCYRGLKFRATAFVTPCYKVSGISASLLWNLKCPSVCYRISGINVSKS